MGKIGQFNAKFLFYFYCHTLPNSCSIELANSSVFYPNPKLHICKIIDPVTPVEPTDPSVSDFHFCHFDRWLQNDGLLCPSLIVTNKQSNQQNKNTMSRRQRGSLCTAAPYLKRGCCTQASSVAEWLGRWTCTSEAPSWNPAMIASWIFSV